MQILRARLADLHHHIILHRLRGELRMEHLHFHYRIALTDRRSLYMTTLLSSRLRTSWLGTANSPSVAVKPVSHILTPPLP